MTQSICQQLCNCTTGITKNSKCKKQSLEADAAPGPQLNGRPRGRVNLINCSCEAADPTVPRRVLLDMNWTHQPPCQCHFPWVPWHCLLLSPDVLCMNCSKFESKIVPIDPDTVLVSLDYNSENWVGISDTWLVQPARDQNDTPLQSISDTSMHSWDGHVVSLRDFAHMNTYAHVQMMFPWFTSKGKWFSKYCSCLELWSSRCT